MRLLLVASSVLALSGCALLLPAAVGGAAVAPAMIPLAGAQGGAGDGVFALGYAHTGADEAHGLEGGNGGSARTLGFIGRGGPGVIMNGRVEAGFFGRDRAYGLTGFDVGPGLRVGPGFVGVTVGYKYGGYPQIGHAVPLRLAALWHLDPAFTLHGSVYAGWRFGIRDEWPAAGRTIGPWNTWGGELALALGARKGLSMGATFDREDDIRVLTIHIAAVMGPGE